MSANAVNRQPPGRPVGGQFARTEHPEPEVVLGAEPLARFPHPDRKYPHPMGAWPAQVELPAAVRLDTADVDTTRAHVRDPQLETSADFPEATIEMRNGATVSARLLPHDEADMAWAGDWARKRRARRGRRRCPRVRDPGRALNRRPGPHRCGAQQAR